ncbi:uncharacterized protein LOC127710658 [Mytilus californianus]|uniref:uncharacterized protein LOC127710658 n=1 Tax=Mytilus californianus TaxID=6549 RepID=UPI002245CE8A|nr:uncharacterized protein LOC127710658 [Mytilus californianus]
MLKLVYLIISICDLCNIVNCLNETDEGVCTNCNGNLTCCCYNYELINGSCVVCQTGFINRNGGSSCIPCEDNWYGKQCLNLCECEFYQRCNHVHGCLNETITTEPIQTSTPEWIWSTAVRENLTTVTSMSFSNVNTMIQNITPLKEITGLLQREIVIYSVVTGSLVVAIGLTSLVRKYRRKSKGKATNPGIPNTNQSKSLRRMRTHVDSASSLYAEIDETMLVENSDMRTWQAKKSPNAIVELKNNDNTSYLSPVHSEGDSSSFRGSEKDVNRSYLSLHASDQNQNSDEFDIDDDATSYLHPYHSIDEDWQEKTHQYGVTHAPSIEVDNSSDSSTQMITDGYLNPYQPLNEDWKQTSHSYEIPVTIHQCQGNSLSSLLPKESLKGDNNEDQIDNNLHNTVNVLHPSQSLTNRNSQTSENYHKQTNFDENTSDKNIPSKTKEMSITCKSEIANTVNVNNDSLLMPSKMEIKEMAASSENNIEHSKESVSRKESELDQVGESGLRKNENVPISCNSLEVQNVIVNDSILNGTNIHVQDYTDAKSQ